MLEGVALLAHLVGCYFREERGCSGNGKCPVVLGLRGYVRQASLGHKLLTLSVVEMCFDLAYQPAVHNGGRFRCDLQAVSAI